MFIFHWSRDIQIYLKLILAWRIDILQFCLQFQGDFYNNCVVGATADVGPREPWHDCHAKVEGPAALDIMKNFEERWLESFQVKFVSL